MLDFVKSISLLPRPPNPQCRRRRCQRRHYTMLTRLPPLLLLHHRPPTLSLPGFFLHPPPPRRLLSSSAAFATSSSVLTHDDFFPYGPSLLKGTQPSPSDPDPDSDFDPTDDVSTSIIFFQEDRFTRVYEISALRVPADQCSALESRLRGHLLNWPRVPNIARVPGDEIDDETLKLLEIGKKKGDDDDDDDGGGGGEERISELSGVLYREKLAREFNARGFVKFRHLAKISRPPRRRRGEKGNEKRVKRGNVGRKSVVMMVEEVVDEEETEEEGFGGLLGEGFEGRKKWKGSTRLLLLDERFVGKEVHELPEAIKEVFRGAYTEGRRSVFELVRCRLTLFYDYWPMNEVLEVLLPKDMIVPSAFETVGHIAHLNLRDEHLPYKEMIAKVVLDKNKPKIHTVVNKVDAITSDYRTMQLEVLAGNHSLVTTVVENGLRFHVDLARVYWNSRLGSERQRLVSRFTGDDVVCDVFAGVGPIAIAAAQRVKRVYANDLNPCAVDYLQRNCVLNKLERKIEVFNMDGRRFIDSLFSSEKAHSITQVVMNLPNDAAEYLDAFRGIFRENRNSRKTALPVIHVYGFSKADDPEFDYHERIRIALLEVAVDVEMHCVRQVAPGKWMLCASFVLPESMAYGKPVS